MPCSFFYIIKYYCFCSVAHCPTLCDSMDCSTPAFPVLHYLPELAQTHVHWVGDGIQPSHPLSLPSSPVGILSQSLWWLDRGAGLNPGDLQRVPSLVSLEAPSFNLWRAHWVPFLPFIFWCSWSSLWNFRVCSCQAVRTRLLDSQSGSHIRHLSSLYWGMGE